MAAGFPVKANYATGDVLTATNMNDLSGTVNYLQYMPPRNPIINSNFSVWQRGTSSAISTSGTYLADRWQGYRAVTGSTYSRQTTNDTTNLPNIQYCARIQRDSGNTSTSALHLQQNFESVNSIPYAGKSIVLSFYARAGANYSSASSALSVQLASGTGTDQNLIFTPYTGAAYPVNSSATLTTTWQRFTFTGTVATTATELAVLFYYTAVGTAGANDYFEVTGVQLELGSVANTYMPNQPTYQGELAACQRYLQLLTTPHPMKANGTTTVYGTVNYQTMRSTPTLSLLNSNAFQITDPGVTSKTQSSAQITIQGSANDGFLFSMANFTSLTSGTIYYSNMSNSVAILASAEL